MTAFSQQLIERSGYLDDSFAEIYDRFRPPPPAEVLRVLELVARARPPRLVVDLGCGTGLATRAWAARAEQVVGIEPNPHMLARARSSTREPNVRYFEAFASETGVAEGAADLVTSFQAFHWMEPQPVLAEAARILRAGGVFAACDYDVPAFVEPEVDDAFAAHFQSRRAARERLGLHAGARTWPKERHVDEIRKSGRFRYARELVAHGWWETDADRMIGLAESLGGPREIFNAQAPEVDETFERFRRTARSALEDETRPVLLCLRLRVGIK